MKQLTSGATSLIDADRFSSSPALPFLLYFFSAASLLNADSIAVPAEG